MELKLARAYVPLAFFAAFNRTFMELKRECLDFVPDILNIF